MALPHDLICPIAHFILSTSASQRHCPGEGHFFPNLRTALWGSIPLAKGRFLGYDVGVSLSYTLAAE